VQCELFRQPAAEDSRLYVASFSIAVTTRAFKRAEGFR
jgi:hypothetical protein